MTLLKEGDAWLVPRRAGHGYRTLETVTAGSLAEVPTRRVIRWQFVDCYTLTWETQDDRSIVHQFRRTSLVGFAFCNIRVSESG